jgi:hypothetical protein
MSVTKDQMSGRCNHRGPLILAVAMVYFCEVGAPSGQAVAQDFQIVWVAVGEAEATSADKPRAGSRLFMAADLMSLSMKNVKVSRVDVSPSVSRLPIGQRLCVSSLSIKAFDAGGGTLKSAPLSISVRQDQKQKLVLERNKNDVCITPSAAGEYPIRFASLLPANDGTTRGAQIFVRVGDTNTSTSQTQPAAVMPLTRLSKSPHSSLPTLRSH